MIAVLFVVYEYLSLTRPSVLLNDPNAIVTAWLLAMEISYNEYRSVVITLAWLVQPAFLRVAFIFGNQWAGMRAIGIDREGHGLCCPNGSKWLLKLGIYAGVDLIFIDVVLI